MIPCSSDSESSVEFSIRSWDGNEEDERVIKLISIKVFSNLKELENVHLSSLQCSQFFGSNVDFKTVEISLSIWRRLELDSLSRICDMVYQASCLTESIESKDCLNIPLKMWLFTKLWSSFSEASVGWAGWTFVSSNLDDWSVLVYKSISCSRLLRLDARTHDPTSPLWSLV